MKPHPACLKLLMEARNAIVSELAAAGAREVAEHPIYRAKDKLVRRIDAFLKRQFERGISK